MAQDENLHVSNHPVILDRLTRLRDKNCPTKDFRHYMQQISTLLAYEAAALLPTKSHKVTTPIEETEGRILDGHSPVLVPILRAGLGLLSGFEYLFHDCSYGHVGLYRDEETKEPVDYLLKLPRNLDRPIFLLDPMLATGHSGVRAAELLIENGAKEEDMIVVFLIAAPEGIATFRKRFPTMKIVIAAIDSHLNENAFIVPGLGDAGDRLLGTE